MKGIRSSGSFFALGVAGLTIVGAGPACAQSASPGERDSGIAEIVVTAQKREQSLQAVPVSVTAFTSEMIEQNQISNVRNLDALAPNLQVKILGGGSAAPQITMRGAVGIGTAPGADKGISLYLDGVYLGSAQGQLFDMADIERIEVLRGPQGTLFGRNSSAGAVSIITRDPVGEFRFSEKATIGNYDQFRSQTRIDTLMAGPFSASLTYTHIERRGDIRNLGGGTVWDFSRVGGSDYVRTVSPKYLGGRNSESFVAALKAEFTPNLTAVYKFDHSEVLMTPPGVGLLATNFTGAFGAAIGGALQNIFDATPNATPITPRRPDAVNNAFTVPTSIRSSGHNLTANWQATDYLSFKNVASYRESVVKSPGSNFDGLGGLVASPAILSILYARVPEPTRTQLIAANTGAPFLGIVSLIGTQQRQASNEFQANFNSKALTLTAGAIYYWQTSDVGGFGTSISSYSLTPFPNFIIPNTNTLDSRVRTVSYAGYGQAEIHVTPQLDLVGGIRVTRDKKSGVDRSVAAAPVSFTYDDTRATYLLGVNFRVTDYQLLYAKYSTGYISGGQLGFTYVPETAKSFEAGAKADWFDHNLRTNLALFHVKYGNLQTATSGRTFAAIRPDLINTGQVLANTGDATAYGFELETTLKPVKPLTLTANVGYTHFKFTSLRPEITQVGGIVPVYRPKWTGNFSAQYETVPLFGEAFLEFRFAGKYTSDQFLTSTTAPFRPQAYVDAAHTGNSWLFDASATLTNLDISGADVKITAWGRNIFNNRKPSDAADVVGMLAVKYEEAPAFGLDLSLAF